MPPAFKCHFLKPRDVPEFVVRDYHPQFGHAVRLGGLFGGVFVAWSAAANAHHGSFRPANPRFNDVVPFEPKWLMDDGVVVEPLVGTRVLDPLAVLDEAMQLVWGPQGVNVEKMAEEGEPSATQLLWAYI